MGLVRTKEQSCTEVWGECTRVVSGHILSGSKHPWQPEEVAVVESESHEQRQRMPMQSQTRSLVTTVAPAGLGEQVAQARISWAEIGIGRIALLSMSRS